MKLVPDKLKPIMRDAKVLWIAARDPRTPRKAKVIMGLVATYALSPIDLIPDFVPVIGWLDDFIVVPIGIRYAMKLIPKDLLAEFRARAESDPDISDKTSGREKGRRRL